MDLLPNLKILNKVKMHAKIVNRKLFITCMWKIPSIHHNSGLLHFSITKIVMGEMKII